MRVFCGMLLIFSLIIPARAPVYLRVVGADDTREAQAEKLRGRDAVLRAVPRDPRLLPAAMKRIAAAARAVAPCTVQFVLYAPKKESLPHLTLLIRVREADGHNWFGLLYQESYALFSSGEGARTFRFPFFDWLFRTRSRR